MNNWYTGKGSGGQGTVIEEETGRTVAVSYDEKDAPLLAAGPALFEAAQAVVEAWATGELAACVRELDLILCDIRREVGE